MWRAKARRGEQEDWGTPPLLSYLFNKPVGRVQALYKLWPLLSTCIICNKKILKPLIKQCIREVVLEEGLLSNIVSEVVQGLGSQPIVESKPPVIENQGHSHVKKQLQETKQIIVNKFFLDIF